MNKIEDERKWIDQWPPVSLGKYIGEDSSNVYVGYAMSMLWKLKNSNALSGIRSGRQSKTLPDGTQIIVSSEFGDDRITIIPSPVEPTIETEQKPQLILYLINTSGDYKLFIIDLNAKTSTSIPSFKFWNDTDFYQGPWSDGFGSGTSSSINKFIKNEQPLVLNTSTYTTWNLVIDNNQNLIGLTYFPVLVLMNVPGASTHSQLGFANGNCFDYPLCLSAIIPASSCALCFAYWPFHGTLPLSYQTLNASQFSLVPIPVNNTVVWTKESNVWSRGVSTNTPRLDITGKTNFTVDPSSGFATSYRESIYPDGTIGYNKKIGTWLNTWNPTLGMYTPCWLDIARGFGDDEPGFWPFWNWLHETPSTGIASYQAYANYIYGGNTRTAQGWKMHYMSVDPSGNVKEQNVELTDLRENLTITSNPCVRTQSMIAPVLQNCSYQIGVFDNASADGTITGQFFSPVATLGNKKFIYFDNTINGYISQTGYRFSGSYAWCNQPSPQCSSIGPCCNSFGWYCFGLCPGCTIVQTLHCESENTLMNAGSQMDTLSINQIFKIGQLQSDGTTIDLVIDQGTHSYLHSFSGQNNVNTGVTATDSFPSNNCGDVIAHCGCNTVTSTPSNYTFNLETETYSRNITTWEVVDYSSDPMKDFTAILYKKIVINHTSANTSDGSKQNWLHTGTRVVTWFLYINLSGTTKTFTIPITFTASRGSGDGNHTGLGSRVYGVSLQYNEDFLAYSYNEESWGSLGANFNSINGQNIYPGPMNLEDRNTQAYYDINGKLIWSNVGCIWNPKKLHYGIISTINNGPVKQLDQMEWTIDITNTTANVNTVGLLSQLTTQ